jgi:hypothetical protein
MHAQRQRGRGWQWPGGFRRSLLAILAGNALYYSLRRYLPEAAQHQPGALDWGLLVNLWFCVAVYGLILLVWPVGKR